MTYLNTMTNGSAESRENDMATVIICEKCKQPLAVGNMESYADVHIKCPATSQPSLSLIVVDFGSCCAVREIIGEIDLSMTPDCLRQCYDSSHLLNCTFAQLKQAIEGEKPDLLPCPFCSSALVSKGQSDVSHYVRCNACEAEIFTNDTEVNVVAKWSARNGKVDDTNGGKWTQLATEPVAVYRYER